MTDHMVIVQTYSLYYQFQPAKCYLAPYLPLSASGYATASNTEHSITWYFLYLIRPQETIGENLDIKISDTSRYL